MIKLVVYLSLLLVFGIGAGDGAYVIDESQLESELVIFEKNNNVNQLDLDDLEEIIVGDSFLPRHSFQVNGYFCLVTHSFSTADNAKPIRAPPAYLV